MDWTGLRTSGAFRPEAGLGWAGFEISGSFGVETRVVHVCATTPQATDDRTGLTSKRSCGVVPFRLISDSKRFLHFRPE